VPLPTAAAVAAGRRFLFRGILFRGILFREIAVGGERWRSGGMEATALKEVVADLTLENRLLKKSVTADGEDGE
jgi:hypothetical protein